jgi:hypothetical protein
MIRTEIKFVAAIIATEALLLVVYFFPYRTDRYQPIQFHPNPFYETAYKEDGKDLTYAERANDAAKRMGIKDKIHHFVADYGLENKKILDVGAGNGLLQDEVEDYTPA